MAAGASLAGNRGSSVLGSEQQPSADLTRSASELENSPRWSMARLRLRGAGGLARWDWGRVDSRKAGTLGTSRFADSGARAPGSGRSPLGKRSGAEAPLFAGTGPGRLLLASPKLSRAPLTRCLPTYIAAVAPAQGFRFPGPLPFREAPALPP